MLNKIRELVLQAGQVVMKIYNKKKSINVYNKIDNSPITQADIESNNIITKGLTKITPQIPILSEENISNWEIRKHWNKYWLIDPLDGTKEFIKHNSDFTINIALIDKKKPILGIIYAPALKIIYSATEKIAWKEDIINNNKFIIKTNKKYISPLKIVVSKSHIYNELKMNNYLNKLKVDYQILKLGSSLKFCLIAEGKVQIYLRFGKTNIWDTAAGQIIATAAGASVNTLKCNKILTYDLEKKSFLNSDFCVSCL